MPQLTPRHTRVEGNVGTEIRAMFDEMHKACKIARTMREFLSHLIVQLHQAWLESGKPPILSCQIKIVRKRGAQ